MNLERIALSTMLSLFSTAAISGSDVGKIVEVYAHPGGQMALRLDNGLPNSNAVNNCGYAGDPTHQFAGVASSDDASIKSAILAAKATNSEVVLVTLGNCLPGGWIKIEAMHVK